MPRIPLKKVGYVTMVTVIGAYAWMAFRGPEGIPALLGKRDEIRRLQQENADLAREVRERRQRIERLKKSADEQELEFRKRLDMVKPGEKQFMIQDRNPGTDR